MNRKDLLLKKHMQMSFPSSATSLDLEEWICELAEVQGHIVGLVEGNAVKAKDLSEAEKFAAKLDEAHINSADENLLNYCRDNVSVLLDLLQSVLKSE